MAQVILPQEIDKALAELANFVQPPPNVLYQHSLKGMPIHEFASRYNYLETGAIGHLFPIHVVITDAIFNPWRYGLGPIKTVLYSTIKKSIKCLALDTPIPTPDGWTTMGELYKGDKVFDEQGQPCAVQAVSDVKTTERCYRIRFTDGTSVVATWDHLWEVESLSALYKRQLLTTEQIANTLRRSDGACNHRLTIPKPLELPDIDLPIEPYTLGAWLGDGASASARITNTDGTILEGIRDEGYVATLQMQSVHSGRTATYGIASTNHIGSRTESPQAILRSMELLGNKHIPAVYLRASIAQRLALLQGLMDTDGHVVKTGKECIFAVANMQLAMDVVKLVRTLGMKPLLRVGRAMLYGHDAGPKYEVRFHATKALPVFRIDYKLERLPSAHAATRSAHVHLCGAEPCESVPVKCISVDSPSHLYLFGESLLPTHNTALNGLVLRWVSETWGGQNECYALASDMEQSRGRVYQAFLTSIEKDPRYDRTKRILPSPPEAGGSDYPIWRIIERDSKHMPTGSIVRAVSADYRGEAGSNPTITAWTELWALRLEKDKRLWDELTIPPTRPRGMRVVDTYAGYRGESNVLWDLWQRIQQDGRRISADEPLGIAWNNAMKLMFMGYRSLGDRPDLADLPLPDTEDPPLWYNEAAQSFGYIDQGRIARRLPWQLGTVGDDYYAEEYASLRSEAYVRLHENEWPDPVNALIPIEWWHNCYDPILKASPNTNYDAAIRRTPMVIGCDAGLSGDCAAIVGVTRHPQKHHETVVRHCRVFTPPRGGKLNYGDTIERELRELCKRYNVVQIAYDEWQLHHLMTELGQGIHNHPDYEKRKPVAWCRQYNQQNPRRVADAMLVQMIRDQQIHHDGTMPDLEDHFLGASAQMSPTEDTRLKIVKRDADSKIDAVVALSMANREALRLNL